MTTPTPPTLDNPPTPPSRVDTANFAARGDAFLAWFTTAWPQIKSMVTWFSDRMGEVTASVQSAADAAALAGSKASSSNTYALLAASSSDSANTYSVAAGDAASTATTKASQAATSASAAAASAAAAAAAVASVGSSGPAIPGQIFTNATPITTDGSIVRTLTDGATTVANLYHSTSSPSIRVVCAAGGYSYNLTDGNAIVSGTSGIDSFYVGKTANVDATFTGGGEDLIYLPYPISRYTITISGTYLLIKGPALTDGRLHGVSVASGTSLVRDKVVFSDGWAYTNDIKTAIANSTAITLNASLTTPETPPTSAYQVAGPVPSNWLYADGRAVSRTDFPGLFARLGTKYGAGDGSTTFNLPAVDTTDKTVVPRSGVAGLFAYIQGY